MQLIINILSGQRKGTKIFLDPISESDILNFVLEDEEISFEYLLTKDQIRKGYCYAKLYLHEVGFDPADYDEENDVFVFSNCGSQSTWYAARSDDFKENLKFICAINSTGFQQFFWNAFQRSRE